MPADVDRGLEKAMKDSLKAYAEGDRQFFDFLKDDVRVFTLESSEPIIGRKAFEEYFGPTFKRFKRKVDVIKQDIQPAGDAAVLSQTLEVTSNEISSFVRQTVIWEQAGKGEWQMSHVHNAQVGKPVVAASAIPKTAEGVRVLNERIATVAATVGVAQ